MTEPATPYIDGRAYTDGPAVEALLDASFAAAGYTTCQCGSVVEPGQHYCFPCWHGTRRPEIVWTMGPPPALTPDDLAHERTLLALADALDAARTERDDLARQVVALRGQLHEIKELSAERIRELRGQVAELQAAAVRATKRGAD